MEKIQTRTPAGMLFARAMMNDEIPFIPFDHFWLKGDYMNGVVTGDYAPSLRPGAMFKSQDGKGRRLIVVGTRFGNVAVFDRQPEQDLGGVYVTNAPKSSVISALFKSGSVDEWVMVIIVGAWNINENIGFLIETMAEEFAIVK